MGKVLLLALVVGFQALAPGDEIERARLSQALHDWDTGKPYLGLSEKEVLDKLGKPTSTKPGVWEYRERHVPDYLFVWVRVVRFKEGKVVSAAREERPVGCIYYGPRER